MNKTSHWLLSRSTICVSFGEVTAFLLQLELVEHARIAGSVDTVFQTAFRTVLRVPK